MNKTLQLFKPKFYKFLTHKYLIQTGLQTSLHTSLHTLKSSVPMSTSTNTNNQDIKYNMIISDLQDLKMEANTLKTMNILLLTFNITFYLDQFIFPFIFK
jgi:hypothetical protein